MPLLNELIQPIKSSSDDLVVQIVDDFNLLEKPVFIKTLKSYDNQFDFNTSELIYDVLEELFNRDND